jgi:hypothetical protein
MNINGLSLSELRVLLSKVESDLANIDSEAAICNKIASGFTGQSLYAKSEYNKKLKADIQIQLDILAFMDNGGKIQFSDYKGAKIGTKSLRGAKAGRKLYNKFAV